jgi:hypothetical protein
VAIQKQEFYEGAALHRLIRAGHLATIRYEPPFFHINDSMYVTLKYSTRTRSPWAFTFMPAEQALLDATAANACLYIGLVCGSDGVVALNYRDLRPLAAPRATAVHVSCYRGHGQHYEVNGPDGRLSRKVAPSDWGRILSPGVSCHEA